MSLNVLIKLFLSKKGVYRNRWYIVYLGWRCCEIDYFVIRYFYSYGGNLIKNSRIVIKYLQQNTTNNFFVSIYRVETTRRSPNCHNIAKQIKLAKLVKKGRILCSRYLGELVQQNYMDIFSFHLSNLLLYTTSHWRVRGHSKIRTSGGGSVKKSIMKLKFYIRRGVKGLNIFIWANVSLENFDIYFS